eukprot:1159225-Pelagomonas_calceolata.AAC.7
MQRFLAQKNPTELKMVPASCMLTENQTKSKLGGNQTSFAPQIDCLRVRGAASEDGAKDAKRARRGASDEAGAEALAAGLRRSERQRKPAQPQQLDTDTEDVNEPRGVPTGDNWEPVPLHGDEAGSE